MDKKILFGKTVKELRTLCTDKSLQIKPNSLKDDIIDQLIRHEQKQKRLLKKAEKLSTESVDGQAPTVPKSKRPSGLVELDKVPPADIERPPSKQRKQPRDNEKEVKKSVGEVKKSVGEVKKSVGEVKKSADGKYTILGQLGSSGKEGTTFLVKNKRGDEYAMKMFPKQKSVNMLLKEAAFQKQVARHGLAPSVKEVDEENKYIVMEKLDKNLFDIVKKHNGEIPDTVQKKIVNIIKKMDDTGVFHGDPNPANFMLKGNTMYMIDYGFAKDIDDRLIKKYETNSPNMKFMILGLILKLKDIYKDHNPDIEYKALSKML